MPSDAGLAPLTGQEKLPPVRNKSSLEPSQTVTSQFDKTDSKGFKGSQIKSVLSPLRAKELPPELQREDVEVTVVPYSKALGRRGQSKPQSQ